MAQKLSEQEVIAKYGKPNETGKGYLTLIKLPFPMYLAWDKTIKVTKISCHKLIAERLLKVFNELLEFYGEDKIHELGIDIYGGCFNYRKMRGGSSMSRHSWGIAIDLDPERNGLKQTFNQSQFSNLDYVTMMDIFYENGFLNYGIEFDLDTMHFETSI